MQFIRDVLRSAFPSVERRYHPEHRSETSTGLSTLDDVILGLRPGTLTVLAGAPLDRRVPHLLQQMAMHTARDTHWVSYFALDTGTHHLALELLLRGPRVDPDALGRGESSAFHNLVKEAGKLATTTLFLNEEFDMTPSQIENACWKLLQRANENHDSLGLACIDSAHGMSPDPDAPPDTDPIPSILTRLSAAARHLQIPFLITIYQNPALLLHHDAVDVLIHLQDSQQSDPPADSTHQEVALHVLRNDAGPCTTVPVQYAPLSQQFSP